MLNFTADNSKRWVARVDQDGEVAIYPVVGWVVTADDNFEPVVYNGAAGCLDRPHGWVEDPDQVRVIRDILGSQWDRAMSDQAGEEESSR